MYLTFRPNRHPQELFLLYYYYYYFDVGNKRRGKIIMIESQEIQDSWRAKWAVPLTTTIKLQHPRGITKDHK